MRAEAAFIEIVERHTGPEFSIGVIKPNEVRINGTPLLLGKEGVTVHEIDMPDKDVVKVTLTLLARRVVIAEELIEENDL